MDVSARQPARILPAMCGEHLGTAAGQPDNPGRGSVPGAPYVRTAPAAPVVEHQRAAARNGSGKHAGAPPAHAQHHQRLIDRAAASRSSRPCP